MQPISLRAVLTTLAVLVAGLGSALFSASAYAASNKVNAHGSAEQVYVLGLKRDAKASLLNSKGHTVQAASADSLGGLLFRNVAPGRGYRVKLATGAESGPVTVHSDAAAPWDPSIYKQKIKDCGYQYLTTRDGTKLAINVHPPTGPAGEPGAPCGSPVPPGSPLSPPYPTLIEYSGYGYARPKSPQNGIAVLANLMGFAVVDVNMRGTGCSGGAFNFFEPLQNLDGYDVIQTIAHQSWVLHHKVGMMGISYGGISQLFTAQLDPPALAAIAPLSVIDATATTLYPGGILNTGFAVAWAQQRQYDAQPASAHGGEPWAYKQIMGGDKTCKANQAIHGEAVRLMAKVRRNNHYRPSVADPLDPDSFVHKIKVPVFMACQWEDEQTGGHCADLVQHFTGTKEKWFNFTNGAHIDSLDPYTYDHWFDFLELFVAHRNPAEFRAQVDAAAPAVYMAAMGTSDFQNDTLPSDPIQSEPTYAAALAAFKKIPEVRVLFDNGAGKSPNGQSQAGDPYPAFTRYFKSIPVPGTKAQWFYMGHGGTLSSKPSKRKEVDWYTSNPSALPLTDFKGGTGGGGLWGNASQWSWNWKQNPAGTAVSYVSPPLKKNMTAIGAGAVHVWIESSAPNVDLQATVSEVRPDHKETFVQDGWMRANERKLATSANNIFKQKPTLLNPIPTEVASDLQAVPRHHFVEVVIPLYYEGHVYRKGSRVRLTIAAPNGVQPVWSFSKPVPALGKTSKVWIAFSKSMPSALVLPVVPMKVPTGLPACPSLRNEPCRTYVPFKNKTAKS